MKIKLTITKRLLIAYILIVLLFAFTSCKVKKNVSKYDKKETTEQVTKVETKTEFVYKDTGSIKTITKYTHYFDTITKKLYVYPSIIEKTENKGIQSKETKNEVYVQELKKSLTESLKQRNKEVKSSGILWSAIYLLILCLAVSIILNIWLFKFK
jgi:hypothetical protein